MTWEAHTNNSSHDPGLPGLRIGLFLYALNSGGEEVVSYLQPVCAKSKKIRPEIIIFTEGDLCTNLVIIMVRIRTVFHK